ncbi:MAG: hypothetical protein ABFD53_08145, partial [Anaerolineaceae bacterium]
MNHPTPQVNPAKGSYSLTNEENTPTDQFSLSIRLVGYIKHYGWDVGGVLALAFGLMSILALLLPGLTGGVLERWAHFLRLWLGWGSLWIAAGGVMLSVLLLRHDTLSLITFAWGRVFAVEIVAFCSLALLSSIGGYSIDRADAGMDGG